jgi:hypothetical protein
MDPISQQRFDTLRKLDPANWTGADREFMIARRPYLTAEEVKALGLVESPTDIPNAQRENEPAPKRGKKTE